MKKAILLFLVFALSLSFAQLIDYSTTVNMGTMRTYIQSDPTYYVTQDVQYNLETDLWVPSSQSDRWLAGSGSYNDIHDGDVVCEGIFYYDTGVNARVDMGDFEGTIPSTSGSDNPNSWPDCVSSCPIGNIYVLWDDPIYGESDHVGQDADDEHYHYRQVTYEEIVGGTQYHNERSDVATIMEGTASLAYARTGGFSLYNFLHSFSPLSGTQPSHDGSFTVTLPAGGTGDYAFYQRMDVDGATILTYSDDMSGNNEKVWSYDSMSMSKYTRSNIHDSSEITIVAEEDVGVDPPSILWVDMGNDGFVLGEGPYEATPGESIPVKIRMYIPDRSDIPYPLSFEFYNVNVDGPTGITFTETSMPADCGDCFFGCGQINGGHLLPYDSYTQDIVGNLNVPADIGEGEQEVSFSVSWRTCSNQHDCDGNGFDEDTPEIIIEIEIPHEGPDPDLICEIEPITYVDGIAPGPDGFAPGQGVEDWRVSVTNIGEGNFSIDSDTWLCSILVFQAYSSDGTEAFDPFYGEALVPSVPDMIVSGETVTFEIEDGTAICVEDEGSEIAAIARVNLLALWYPDCVPYTPFETNYWNNQCTWTAPCTEGPGNQSNECTIIPSNYNNPDSEEILPFELFCDGDTCTGPVAWTEEDVGDDIADMIDSDQLGATAQATTYEEEDELSGTTILTATVGYPDNMICNATITLNADEIPENGEDEYCYCEETPQTGYPGSMHEFEVWCVEEGEDPEHCGASWSINEGSEFVSGTNGGSGTYWYDVYISESIAISEEAEVEVRAKPGGIPPCYCYINLPPMDCLDFI